MYTEQLRAVITPGDRRRSSSLRAEGPLGVRCPQRTGRGSDACVRAFPQVDLGRGVISGVDPCPVTLSCIDAGRDDVLGHWGFVRW